MGIRTPYHTPDPCFMQGEGIVQLVYKPMTERIKSILIGLVLGDAYLTPFTGKSKGSRVDIKGDNRYLSYLQWLHSELTPLGVSELKPKKNYHQHRFYTKTSDEVGTLRNTFYSKGIKIIPKQIQQFLTDPITLAVWYQDDGTLDYRKKDHYNSLFATHCFSFSDCVLLANALRENFALDARVYRCQMRGKLRFRIYIVSGSTGRFMSLVRPYVLPCFSHKVREYT